MEPKLILVNKAPFLCFLCFFSKNLVFLGENNYNLVNLCV
jgi:hypothetical protein